MNFRTRGRIHLAVVCVLLAFIGVTVHADGLTVGPRQTNDGTIIINPRILVRASPTYLTQDVPLPVTITVLDGRGAGVIGATVRLANANDQTVVLGTGVTGGGGRAIIGPVRPSAAEAGPGVRVSVTSAAGSRSDTILRVRPAAGTFSVLELRIIEPAEGARPSVAVGESLRLLGLVRGIGTGTVTGWWEVNGMPIVPFTASMRSGAPVRVEVRDPVQISSKFRIGPNTVRLRTIVPNRLESRYTAIDVYKVGAAGRGLTGHSADLSANSVRFMMLNDPGQLRDATYHWTPKDTPFELSVVINGAGSGEVRGEWWLDGRFVADFAGTMTEGQAGPSAVAASLLRVAEDATHYLRLRVISPNRVDSPVFAYDVGESRASRPVDISLVAPIGGAEVTGAAPVFRWLRVPSSVRYVLSIGSARDGNDIESFWTGAVPVGEAEIVEFAAPGVILWEPGETYYWKVVADRPGQDAPSSPVDSFTIAETPVP